MVIKNQQFLALNIDLILIIKSLNLVLPAFTALCILVFMDMLVVVINYSEGVNQTA
ncbi:hypothetical protein BPUTEOSOX_196 [thiotrophic endosymbiont of Bathymodiolus puteoserpentis (Logatchev)]|nr:hypothetical protein BPUTEOSOX_196 [thiotrophic endosymbiont of Bathymodiolus puteoserpentis (Logatchev)]